MSTFMNNPNLSLNDLYQEQSKFEFNVTHHLSTLENHLREVIDTGLSLTISTNDVEFADNLHATMFLSINWENAA